MSDDITKIFWREVVQIQSKYFPSNDIFKGYHYTNFNGLKGILDTKTIWLTDYASMNDPLEIVFSKQLFDQKIREYMPNYFNVQLRDEFNIAIERKLINFYVASFCSEADYLPAWRLYGDNGWGFSIKFDFGSYGIKNKNHYPVFFENIDYHGDDIEKKVEMYIKDLGECLVRYLFLYEEVYFYKPSAKFADDLFMSVVESMLRVLPRIKQADYAGEKEKRLFLTYLLDSNSKPIESLKLPEGFIVSSRKKIYRFIDSACANLSMCDKEVDQSLIKMPIECSNIREIHVGPCYCVNGMLGKITNVLEGLLDLYCPGYEIKIVGSEKQYRG